MPADGAPFISNEATLSERLADIASHLQASRRPLRWRGQGGIELVGEAFGNSAAERAVLLVTGRVESFLKYDELTDELLRNGYAVYRFDHRGQGLSGRLLADRHKGHIDSYAAFVADLQQVIASISSNGSHHHLLLIAHSMGACISALALADSRTTAITGAALCSPMVRLKSGGLPHWAALVWLNLWHLLLSWLHRASGDSPYFRDGGPYRERPFEDNHISHSLTRYRMFRAMLAQRPDTQLGDPTLAWVARSFRAAARAVTLASQIRAPLLVLEAGADPLIDPRGIARFCLRAPHCRYLRIDHARHELLFESDPMRQPALLAIYRFFDHCCSGAPQP
ncbi:MAG: alpha/beta fold hydrolase [Gammaproteobacteria bacterium]|nr:alpha/beta fold hydrolase [Gammaproteobacteria bacterium]